MICQSQNSSSIDGKTSKPNSTLQYQLIACYSFMLVTSKPFNYQIGHPNFTWIH